MRPKTMLISPRDSILHLEFFNILHQFTLLRLRKSINSAIFAHSCGKRRRDEYIRAYVEEKCKQPSPCYIHKISTAVFSSFLLVSFAVVWNRQENLKRIQYLIQQDNSKYEQKNVNRLLRIE